MHKCGTEKMSTVSVHSLAQVAGEDEHNSSSHSPSSSILQEPTNVPDPCTRSEFPMPEMEVSLHQDAKLEFRWWVSRSKQKAHQLLGTASCNSIYTSTDIR